MKILGIETSCDETAAAVVEDGKNILSSVISSQFHIHEKFGGVVPELASRDHMRQIVPIIDEALKKAGMTLQEIDAIAVTKGPGLIGSLMVGVTVAKTIAYAHKKPLIPVHHIEGHLSAAFLGNPEIEFPFVGLVASGGHTHLYYVPKMGTYELIGKTIDDAAGEAFDKVAKLLGLGFPGGPALDKISKTGNPKFINFPRPFQQGMDFSFSGLKTSAMVWLKDHAGENYKIEDVAASFQEAIVDTLVKKLKKAVELKGVNQLVICGGVAANSRLRTKLGTEFSGVNVALTPLAYCTDNAAMIATSAYFQNYDSKTFKEFELEAQANISLSK
jgi:N6-L-threonylcarbamoyladenine synthase